MPNVPHDIPVPHTLVLDLEQTLVSASWERKTGWRYAKRPGVDKFLHVLAQYYEIVVYSPSVDAVADPVITILDKSGCVMHRLYRDATHFHKGVHVKDLNRLNRDVNRMILLDDEPQAAAFNPDNLIQVKPYLDPTDQSDNTLERITPLLVEIARKGYSDIPTILRQYRGMNSDQIADEYERRIDNLRSNRMHSSSLLGGFASRSAASLPPPEMTPSSFDNDFLGTKQITAKDVVGAGPPSSTSNGSFVQWMNRRSKEKEEEQMRKMEKWNEVMMKKQQAKQAEASRT
jgi:mitochondrial import inner membrane translocase subunit TIM50